MKIRRSGTRTPSTKSQDQVRAKRPVNKPKTGARNAKYPDIRRDLERQRAAILNDVGEVLTHRGDLAAFPDASNYNNSMNRRRYARKRGIERLLDGFIRAHQQKIVHGTSELGVVV